MPGPWTQKEFDEAASYVNDPGLDPALKQQLEGEMVKFLNAQAQSKNAGKTAPVPGVSPGQNTSAAAPPAGPSPSVMTSRPELPALVAAVRAERLKGTPAGKAQIDPENVRPSSGEGSGVPVVYLEDDDADANENARRYSQVYDQAQQGGKSVYRGRDIPGTRGTLMRAGQHVRNAVTSAADGVVQGASMSIMDPEADFPKAHEIGQAAEQYPGSNLVGRLGGALAGGPGQIAKLVGEGVPAATVGRRMLQGISQALKAATVEGSAEAGAGLGRGKDPEAVKRQLIGTLGLSGLVGGLAQGTREAGRAIRGRVERGPLGVDLQRLGEETGGKPVDVIGGTKMPKSVRESLDVQEASRGKLRAENVPARKATGIAQEEMGKQMQSTRGRIAGEKGAYRASPEGQDAKSLKPVYDRVKDILERDQVEGGQMAFETSSRLKGELKKLVRAEVVPETDPGIDEALDVLPIERAAEYGLEAPEGAEGMVVLLRPVKMNAQQLDRQIRNLDEVSKQAATTSTPGTRELGELSAVARGVRDEFGPNEVAPGGYSALRGQHSKMLKDLSNKLYSMGLPKDLKDIDPADEEQVDKVFQAISQYGNKPNEVRDMSLDALAKSNPALAKALREKLTMDSYRRVSVGDGPGFSLSPGGASEYLKPATVRGRLHGLGVNLERGTPRPGRVGATVSPIYGPLEGLLRRPKREEQEQ